MSSSDDEVRDTLGRVICGGTSTSIMMSVDLLRVDERGGTRRRRDEVARCWIGVEDDDEQVEGGAGLNSLLTLPNPATLLTLNSLLLPVTPLVDFPPPDNEAASEAVEAADDRRRCADAGGTTTVGVDEEGTDMSDVPA